MIWVIGWLIGSLLSWVCFLKVSKVKLGQTNFSCGDLMFYGILSLLAGPLGMGSALLIWVIEELSDKKYESAKCKNLAKWISGKI